MPLRQNIRTRIFPIQGLDLSPKTPDGEVVLGEDIDVVLALVGGRAPQGTSLLSLADDGSLKVSIQGAALNEYTYQAGTAGDDYDADNTVVLSAPTGHITLAISEHPAKFQFRNPSGQWGAEIDTVVGDTWDYDFQCTGMRIKNATEGSNAKWLFLTLS